MYISILTGYILNAMWILDAAKILAVYPTPSISHQVFFRPITQELVRRGHDIVVITPDPGFPMDQSPANLKEIEVHDLSYRIWNEEISKSMATSQELHKSMGTSEVDMSAQLKMYLYINLVIVKQQLFSNEVQDLINNKENSFDLILIEAWTQPALIYSHIFKAPVIQVSSFGPMPDANSFLGASNHPLFQPSVYRKTIYNLTFWETIRGIYRQYNYEYILNSYKHEQDIILKKMFGSDTPTLHELLNDIEMMFINFHAIWNHNSPVPPALNYMGGLHQQPVKELPEDLQYCLDSSKNGVIYVSFGTNVRPSMVPPHAIKHMTKVLSELPYDVIWKWETDLPNRNENIKVFKWLPQSDLLRELFAGHPKIKLFITQGGLQSTDEAITGGVPVIGLPVLGDQGYNVEKYVYLGIGKRLELETLTEESFRNAVVTVIENNSYRNNIVRLRTLVQDQPQTPLERTITLIEHVLRHGGARHLRCSAANMSWQEYYELELVIILFLCLLTIVILLTLALYYVEHYIRTLIFGTNIRFHT